MNAPESRLALPAIGTQLAGGFVLGHLFIGAEPFSLIVPSHAVAPHIVTPWSKTDARIENAQSLVDGLANTRAMASAGADLGCWAVEQRIDGRDDWYVPARLEMLTLFAGMKAAGPDWQEGGAEAFNAEDWYWTSTQHEHTASWAWDQWFDDGTQYYDPKSLQGRAFVVRREPIR